MKKFILFIIILSLVGISIHSQTPRPLAPEDIFKIKRVSSSKVSPDGNWIAFTVSVPDLASNSSNSDIWLLPLKGGSPFQLTNSPKNDDSPSWSPDSKHIAFISGRGENANIYVIGIDGGEARKLTSTAFDLSSPIWSADGKYILCTSNVLPENKQNIENWTKKELPASKARAIDRLLFREGKQWLGDTRNHLFLVSYPDGSLKDITPFDADVPPVSLISGSSFDISPQGNEVCFVRNDSPIHALSTNHDIFVLQTETMKETRITDNPALDRQPVYSPDGRYIAYLAMKTPGYESDMERLMVYDRQKKTIQNLTQRLDLSVNQFTWSPKSDSLYFTCFREGRSVIYSVDLKGNSRSIYKIGYNTGLNVTPDGKKLFFLHSTATIPTEIYSIDLNSKNLKAQEFEAHPLTSFNTSFISQFDISPLEDFWFKGADDTPVHGFLMKPPAFDPAKKYPVILCIHGGPQGMFSDRFLTGGFIHTMLTAPGYVAVFINPRGSQGFGELFMNQVSKDYGNRSYIDLMKGMDYVIATHPFIDKDRQAAIGASFGGYMVDWIMGHTDRFKCLVSHAGLFNLTSFYGTTEEVWFPAWDMGNTPWDESELYDKWSPSKFVKNFKTPTLVTQGEIDFRVNLSESLQLFTALQRQNIPSRLVVFPDEGHVISKHQNIVRWWKEIQRWFKLYLSN